MGTNRILLNALGVEGAVLERVYEEEAGLVLAVRVGWRHRWQCSVCGRRCRRFDRRGRLRRWRALDVGRRRCWLEASLPRVWCPEHGRRVAKVPWARRDSRFTRRFEDLVAWQAAQMNRTAVTQLLRITWRSVTRIVERVVAELHSRENPLADLEEIGIDEISYKKGHKYLTIVVDHRRNRLVYAAEGRDRAAVEGFFQALGPEGCARLKLVTTDGANWIQEVVRTYAPQAELCLDPFHVVQWATDALDQIRRQTWNRLRRSPDPLQRQLARSLKRSRFVLWKGSERHTPKDRAKLAQIRRLNEPLWRAYLLREQLRQILRAKGQAAVSALQAWLAWAQRSRLQPFVELARRIRRHLPDLTATLLLGASNARIEAANTRLRLLHRTAFGFHSASTMIAMAYLTVGKLCPSYPSPDTKGRRARNP